LETRIFPLEVAERFALEDLKSEPFIVLLRRNADTEVHRVVYRTRSSQLLEMEAEMMGIPEGSPALVRAGVHYNRTDQPMMTGRVTFPAEKVELHFEVRKDQRIQERLTLK